VRPKRLTLKKIMKKEGWGEGGMDTGEGLRLRITQQQEEGGWKGGCLKIGGAAHHGCLGGGEGWGSRKLRGEGKLRGTGRSVT